MKFDPLKLMAFREDLKKLCELYNIDAAFFLFATGEEMYGVDVKAIEKDTPQMQFLQILRDSNLNSIKNMSGGK
jgi:hypothetical protein